MSGLSQLQKCLGDLLGAGRLGAHSVGCVFDARRQRLNLLGSCLGLGLGLAFAVLLEYRDTSLRSEEDVLVALSLPVLAFVPTMITAAERRKQQRLKLLLASSGLVAVVLSVAVVAWKFRAVAAWIR